MKKAVLIGLLSALAVLGLASILTPAKATDDGLPVGTIIAWGGPSTSVPAGWMLCNGKSLSKAAYAELFAAIGTSWGSVGDKFNLPDLRGRFLRGDDAGTNRDPDAKKRAPSNPGGNTTGVGSAQGDSFQNHTHVQNGHSHGSHWHQYSYSAPTGSNFTAAMYPTASSTDAALADIRGAKAYGTKSALSAGEESRPKNAAVNFIIKVK